MSRQFQDFITFIREKGVLGLAVGIIVGGAVSKMVSAIVNDLINPLIGAVTGLNGSLGALSYTIPFTEITFKWGDFVLNLIEFLSILFVVYVIFVKTPIIRTLDKQPEDKK